MKRLFILKQHLTKSETNELLGLVQERRILANIVSIFCMILYSPDIPLAPWMANKDHFELFFNTLGVAYPQVKLHGGKIRQKLYNLQIDFFLLIFALKITDVH